MSADAPADDPEPLADPPAIEEIGEQFGEDVAADLSEIWTVISRAWHSNFFDLSEDDPEAMLRAYVSATGSERETLAALVGELGKCRPSSRSYASLTAVEAEISVRLRRLARQEGDR